MQSPFDNANKTCVLYLEPMLNTYYKSYQNILTVSNLPEGPLSSLVQTISSPKLSPFQIVSRFSPPPTSRNSYSQICMLALSRYPLSANNGGIKCADNFMTADDIPKVIGYLESNGYKIMADVTHLAYKSQVNLSSASSGRFNRRQLLFMFRYEGK